MKKLIVSAALAVASICAAAGKVDVSSVTGKAVVKATDITGKAATFNVQLTDGTRTCTSGTLEAVVTNKEGTAIACWRIIGDNVYLTGLIGIFMRDTMVPLSAFEGDGVAKLRGSASELPNGNNRQSASKDRASAMAALQEKAGTGGESTAARTSGPSGNYAGRVRAAVRPNITYPDVETLAGNPAAEFEVNLASDGTIIGVKLRKSSGVPGWDEAAERALRRTDELPRDTDGRIYTPMIIALRPKD